MRKKDEIRALLGRLDGEPADALEDEDIDFTTWDPNPRSRMRALRESVVCFANARGGTIVLGVRDRARSRREAIQGITDCDINSIRRDVYNGTEPHILVDVEELVEPEGRLLLVHVPKGMPPHTTTDGVAKIRVGKECQPLTGGMLARLLAAGGQRDPTAEPVERATEDDLDAGEIARLRSLIRTGAGDARLAGLDGRALLEALGLVLDGGVALAGLLVLGTEKALARFVPQHEVVFLRYRSATRYDQRHDLRGPLLAVLREMEGLVSANNRVRTVQEESFGQLEFPDLSWEVAREAVLNAVTHRDYFLRQGVQVALYRDRLDVASPGGFVGGITPENILRHPPVHRNELLARVLQTVGLVNRVGLGVDRIYEGLLRLGKDLPRYEADEAHVRLSVPLETHDEFAKVVAGEERKGRPLALDDLIILRAFVGTPSLDRWSAAEVLELPEDEAARRLADLRERGFLTVRGRGRAASYDLRRDLAVRLRGRSAADAETPLQAEAVKLRTLALLRERGRLTNAEIRRFSGFNRVRVYRLMKELETEGKVRFEGKGRGAHVLLSEKRTRRRRARGDPHG